MQFGQMNLIQNCDLPPPVKIFMGSNNKQVVSSMNRLFHLNTGLDLDDETEKSELLKALRLLQTRAREAEKKAESLAKERDFLSRALLDEAKQLFAHRLWVRLLELQVLRLNSNWAEKENDRISIEDHDHHDDDHDGVCVNWVVALAFCFGIAGFAFGCRCLF